jgi:ABC-2 type transport system ATP-binding protein
MLEVKKLKRNYGDFIAVGGVDFSIAKGEIVGLLGHNGAGKTTVMKMLSGYLEPSEGAVLFDELDLAKNLKSLQQKIGYLPENLPLYSDMSVADYLDYAAELKGLTGVNKKNEIKRVVTATDITSKWLATISTLSRGYKQRVGVAQALLGNPRLLILDEPTNGLDPTQTLQMRELIRHIAKDATVILSTHIMQEVDAICDRVLMMRAGHLVIDAKLADLRLSRSIHLSCAGNLALVLETLKKIEGIADVTPINEPQKNYPQHSLSVKLDNQSEFHVLSALIVKTLVNSGIDIYHIRSETRDLETLFREANQKETLNYAA